MSIFLLGFSRAFYSDIFFISIYNIKINLEYPKSIYRYQLKVKNVIERTLLVLPFSCFSTCSLLYLVLSILDGIFVLPSTSSGGRPRTKSNDGNCTTFPSSPAAATTTTRCCSRSLSRWKLQSSPQRAHY